MRAEKEDSDFKDIGTGNVALDTETSLTPTRKIPPTKDLQHSLQQTDSPDVISSGYKTPG